MLTRKLFQSTTRLCNVSTLRSVSCFSKKFALTRQIDDSLAIDALTLNESHKKTIDLERARRQHALLNEELVKAGLIVLELESESYPDSVFIEDTAVIIDKTAMITTPGAASRQGEVKAVRNYLQSKLNSSWELVDLPEGTVDGGDVLFTGIYS